MKKLTILMALAIVVCLSVPVMAVDWNFYGSARMATFWTSRDYKDGTNDAGTDSKDSDLDWELYGGSRIGANVKADHIKGQIEMGLSDGGGDGEVTTRRVYGTWNFGAGSLKVGKDYTPVTQFISGQIGRRDAGLIGFGAPYASRPGQVALTMGGFDLALITPRTSEDLENSAGVASGGDVDTIIPKIEASWGMGYDAFSFKIMGGYQYYSISDVTSLVDGSTNDIDVTSYIIAGGGQYNFGPAYVGAQIMYGRNMGNARWSGGEFDLAGWDGDDSTNDVDTLGGILVAGMKVSDMLSFEAGIGYIQDDPKDADNGFDEKTKAMDVYVQSVIVMAPGVYIIPEIGFASFGNTPTDSDQGSDWYAGGKWQIDF